MWPHIVKVSDRLTPYLVFPKLIKHPLIIMKLKMFPSKLVITIWPLPMRRVIMFSWMPSVSHFRLFSGLFYPFYSNPRLLLCMLWILQGPLRLPKLTLLLWLTYLFMQLFHPSLFNPSGNARISHHFKLTPALCSNLSLTNCSVQLHLSNVIMFKFLDPIWFASWLRLPNNLLCLRISTRWRIDIDINFWNP